MRFESHHTKAPPASLLAGQVSAAAEGLPEVDVLAEGADILVSAQKAQDKWIQVMKELWRSVRHPDRQPARRVLVSRPAQ